MFSLFNPLVSINAPIIVYFKATTTKSNIQMYIKCFEYHFIPIPFSINGERFDFKQKVLQVFSRSSIYNNLKTGFPDKIKIKISPPFCFFFSRLSRQQTREALLLFLVFYHRLVSLSVCSPLRMRLG